jgi:phosphatidylserine/phosphatidylglycerophosphate/cardiolipin synthase-like enzyme
MRPALGVKSRGGSNAEFVSHGLGKECGVVRARVPTASPVSTDMGAILDNSQDRREIGRTCYAGATYLTNAGIPVWIDDAPAIAHKKVLVIDGATAITDSFNFTAAADRRNAEKVVVLQRPELGTCFAQNWEERRAASRAFGRSGAALVFNSTRSRWRR